MSGGSIGPFQTACGATGPLRVSVEAPGRQPLHRVFSRPFLLLGRSDHADLRLSDPAVSRQHAYLQLVEGRAFCVDLHSRTGTRWLGAAWIPVAAPCNAQQPFQIRLGAFRTFPEGPDPQSARSPYPAEDLLPGVSLDI
jgi:hypothetical protein